MIDQANENSGQPHFDAGIQQLAAVYAKALLGATEKAGNTADVADEFEALIQLINAQPRFAQVLASQLLGDDEKQAIIDRVFAPSSPQRWSTFCGCSRGIRGWTCWGPFKPNSTGKSTICAGSSA